MRKWKVMVVGMAGMATAVWAGPQEVTTYNPKMPSHSVNCNGIARSIGNVPHGNGDGITSDEEVGRGGWRYSSRGKSFITQRYTLNSGRSGYDVLLGQSNFIGNRGIVNDYPRVLDYWTYPVPRTLVFANGSGELVLTGDPSVTPPRFSFPGQGSGTVRIPMRDPEGDGTFVGCKASPWLKNFGLLVSEGGDYLQQSLYKVYAKTDATGMVTSLEWTEIVLFKNVRPGKN